MSGEQYQILPALSDNDYRALKDDIAARGVMVPVEYDDSGNVIDGHHRIKICKELGIKEWPRLVRTYQDDAAKRTQARKLNIARRHLDTAAKRELIEQELRENPARSGRQIAVDLGVDNKTVESVRDNLERREEIPHVEQRRDTLGRNQPASKPKLLKIIDESADGEKAISAGAKDIRDRKTAERKSANDAVKSTKTILPDGKFDVIVMDPPWPMEKIEREVRPNQVAFDYPVMSIDELVAYWAEIEPRVAADCHFFLWTTNKFLPVAFRLLDAWSLNYVCEFVWKKSGGFQPVGLPQFNHESVLYARRGSPKFVDTKAFPTCFEAPRRGHSRKPEEFYQLIARVTDGRRVDWFSREPRTGFEAIGNESGKFAGAA